MVRSQLRVPSVQLSGIGGCASLTLTALALCLGACGTAGDSLREDVPEFVGGVPGSSPSMPGSSGPSNAPPAANAASGGTQTNGQPVGAAPQASNEGNPPVQPGPISPPAQVPASSQGSGGSSMVAPGAGGAGTMPSGTEPDDSPDPGPDLEPDPAPVPPPVVPPPVVPPPVVPPPAPVFETACPAGAFFCTGFENGFPAGTANVLGGSEIPNPFALDTTEKNGGAQSYFLPAGPNQSFLYRVLSIPVATQQFWVRMFFRTDVAFGSSTVHESLFGPSTGALTQNNNNETRIELSEQFGYMLINVKDATSEPLVRRQLTANAWHCIEARYDGDAGEVEIFADEVQFINEQSPRFQLDFQTFRLGYMKFNGTTRAVRFDDVVLAPDRIGCD